MGIHRQLGWMVCLLPCAGALVLVGPGMVSKAEGCSGATGQMSPGWNQLELMADDALPTNGAIVLRGALKDLTEEEALGALTLTVEDGANNLVGGTASLEDLGAYAGSSWIGGRDVAVVWQPAASFAPSATYQVKWSIDPTSSKYSISGEGSLTTQAAASTPAEPGSLTAAFTRTRSLAGPTVTCTKPAAYSCGPWQVTFGTTELQLPSLKLSFSFHDAPLSTYQIAHVEPVAGKGVIDGVLPIFGDLPPYNPGPFEATLTFSDDVPEYCVRVVTTDLIAGTSTEQTACALPDDAEAPGESLLKQWVGSCEKPPSAQLTATWCKSHADAAECADESSSGCTLSTRDSSSGGRVWVGLGLAAGLLLRRRG